MIKVGRCGFPVKRDIYYQTFPVVEIQQTFYQLPRIDTGEKWKKEAPPVKTLLEHWNNGMMEY